MAARNPYVRSMRGWWRRDPYFLHYMAREATAVFVVAYAIVLLVGIVRLFQGRAAFDGWVAALSSAPSIALHGVLLAAFVYHSVTWFAIMPKTLPPIEIGGRRLGPAAITGAGLGCAVLASSVLWLIVKLIVL